MLTLQVHFWFLFCLFMEFWTDIDNFTKNKFYFYYQVCFLSLDCIELRMTWLHQISKIGYKHPHSCKG